MNLKTTLIISLATITLMLLAAPAMAQQSSVSVDKMKWISSTGQVMTTEDFWAKPYVKTGNEMKFEITISVASTSIDLCSPQIKYQFTKPDGTTTTWNTKTITDGCIEGGRDYTVEIASGVTPEQAGDWVLDARLLTEDGTEISSDTQTFTVQKSVPDADLTINWVKELSVVGGTATALSVLGWVAIRRPF